VFHFEFIVSKGYTFKFLAEHREMPDGYTIKLCHKKHTRKSMYFLASETINKGENWF